jgi:adenylate cyclase
VADIRAINDSAMNEAEPIDPGVEAEWRKLLEEGHRPLKIMHAVFRHLPTEPRCKVCHNPFGGVGGKLVGLAGFKPSPKNPNLCSACCEGLPPGGAEVDLAVLFADVRGSTGMGERMTSTEYAALLQRYYVTATRVLIRHDAIIDKLIGDEVMALFIPGICGKEFRRHAAEAAIDLLREVGYGAERKPWLPVGVGVHAGRAFVGNIAPDKMVDFTALGDAVNIAARLRDEAKAGEAILSEGIYAEVRERFPELVERQLELRGREEPVAVRVLYL